MSYTAGHLLGPEHTSCSVLAIVTAVTDEASEYQAWYTFSVLLENEQLMEAGFNLQLNVTGARPMVDELYYLELVYTMLIINQCD